MKSFLSWFVCVCVRRMRSRILQQYLVDSFNHSHIIHLSALLPGKEGVCIFTFYLLFLCVCACV